MRNSCYAIVLLFLLVQPPITSASAQLLANGAVPTPETNAAQSAVKESETAAWKGWNKAIADELFNRIKQDLLRLGPRDVERSFYCKVHWRIQDDGRILVLQIDGPQSEVFRSIVRSAADSMQRSSFTKFPEGSTKTHIKKITHYKFDWRNPMPGEPLGTDDIDPTNYTGPVKSE